MDQELKQQFDKINERFDKVDERFEQTDHKFEDLLLAVKDGFDDTSKRLNRVETDITQLKTDVTYLKSSSITKEYLDDKLSDLGAEIGRKINLSAQKEKTFHTKLIEFLKTDRVLKQEHIMELEKMLV